MSEITTVDLEHQFAEIVRSSLEPDWQEFERMAALPAVQRFCTFELRYDDPWEDDDNPDIFAFTPRAEVFSVDEAVNHLNEAYHRLDTFADAIVSGYCA